MNSYSLSERAAVLSGSREAQHTSAELVATMNVARRTAEGLRAETLRLRNRARNIRESRESPGPPERRLRLDQLRAVRAQRRSRPIVRASTRDTHI